MYQVDNAIIMAAGTSSRFAPLSKEKHKALIDVKGEILLERQIRQLQEAGIPEIYIVTGYKSEQFEYLKEKFGVHLVHNEDYLIRNNNSSIYRVRHLLKNSYICSSDNYFGQNPFESQVDDSYYAAVFAHGETKEWCMSEDADGFISEVKIGGSNAWYMLGHVFWSEEFSRRFVKILEGIYDEPETADKLWESIYIENLSELKMHIRKYPDDVIFEFDTLDELRQFDTSYIYDTRSKILKKIARDLNGTESELIEVVSYKGNNTAAAGMCFTFRGNRYVYSYDTEELRRMN